jgi:hypothetical protein
MEQAPVPRLATASLGHAAVPGDIRRAMRPYSEMKAVARSFFGSARSRASASQAWIINAKTLAQLWRLAQSNFRTLVKSVPAASLFPISLLIMGEPQLQSLLFRFGLGRFSQSHARPSTVFVDELDAGGLQGSTNDIKRCASGLCSFFFKLMDGHYPNARAVRHANRDDAGGLARCAADGVRPAQRSKGDNRDRNAAHARRVRPNRHQCRSNCSGARTVRHV